MKRLHIYKSVMVLVMLIPATLLAGIKEDIANMKPGEWYEIPNSKLSESNVAPNPLPYGNSGLKSVISAWCGGIYDTKRERLVIWGGGHNDYSGNELYAFDMKSFKWLRIWGPTPNKLIPTKSGPYQEYQDGNPSSRHTYNTIQYIPELDALWNHGGSPWRAGGPIKIPYVPTWLFNMKRLEWEKAGKMKEGGRSSAYDPVTGHVFARTMYGVYEYNPATREWKKRYRYSGGWWPYPTAAIDPDSRKMLLAGAKRLDVFDIESFQYKTYSMKDVKGDTSILTGKAPGFVYVSAIKKFVAWDGSNSREISSLDVFVVDGKTMQIEKRPPASTNTVVPTNAPKAGTYGRFQYIPSMDRFIVVNSISDSVYVYRLSNLTGDAPGYGSTHKMGKLRVLPTRYGVGIEWDIAYHANRDINHNAQVFVTYKKKNAAHWKKALPLMRVDAFKFNMMAGSIMFLEPDSQYDLRLEYSDPEGGKWSEARAYKTLPVPEKPKDGRMLYIAPGKGGGKGTSTDPFLGIAAAKKAARPGDTFILADGDYYGVVHFNVKGAPGRYIVWQGSGNTVFHNKIRLDKSYNWFENIDFQLETDCTGIYSSGDSFENAPSHIVITKNRFSGAQSCGTKFFFIHGAPHARNWYVTDNIITGPYHLDVHTFGGEGIDMGHHTPFPNGHTIAHNRITRVGDGISYVGGNCDIFGNDLLEILDDAIEPDYGSSNVRVYRNRITMAKHNAISLQDFDNGMPWYIVGNQIIGYGQSVLKTRQGENEFAFYHNTVVNWKSMFLHQTSFALFGHSKNNIMISMSDGSMWDFQSARPDWRTDIDYNAFDWGQSKRPFWFGGKKYKDLKEYRRASGLDRNSIRIDRHRCFESLEYPGPFPKTIPLQYLKLKPTCAVIDKGVVLPGINDEFVGKAPDIGAYEYGLPLPEYGPRKDPLSALNR